jgi:uncharacterized protein YggE
MMPSMPSARFLSVLAASCLRGGSQQLALEPRLPAPDPQTAERVIAIEGRAVLRVVPSGLRVVLALSAAAPSAVEAAAAGRTLVETVCTRLTGAKVAADAIDVDFIATVPIYAWAVEEQAGKEVLAERRKGMRIQYNLHVAVPDESAARVATEAATAVPGVDLLAVDYWSDRLAEVQVEAMRSALAAAQAKAAVLLAVFPTPPVPINVHESTRVFQPQHLYHALTATEDSAGSFYAGHEIPRIPASRPMNVYYRGLVGDVDVMPQQMPGRRDIEVVSTVRLYYEAPGRPAPAGSGPR